MNCGSAAHSLPERLASAADCSRDGPSRQRGRTVSGPRTPVTSAGGRSPLIRSLFCCSGSPSGPRGRAASADDAASSATRPGSTSGVIGSDFSPPWRCTASGTAADRGGVESPGSAECSGDVPSPMTRGAPVNPGARPQQWSAIRWLSLARRAATGDMGVGRPASLPWNRPDARPPLYAATSARWSVTLPTSVSSPRDRYICRSVTARSNGMRRSSRVLNCSRKSRSNS
jgi:hypothetical protein